jgi:hypothetical protein
MTSDDEFATWDAAYVLGALSPVERHRYEAHLRECDRCAAAVAELAGMPGILSRVPREQAEGLLAADETGDAHSGATPAVPAADPPPDGPSRDVLPALLHRARRRRARGRWLVGALSAVAATALVGVAAFVLPGVISPAPPQAAVVMQQVEPSALSADLRLTEEPWGTRIDSRCRYARVGSGDGGHAWTYAMVVTDRSGAQHQVSTWVADEGTTAVPVATTSVPLKDIAAVDIRSAGDGTVLLRSTFG